MSGHPDGPQPAFIELEQDGALPRRVMEIGCGDGELTLFLAMQGHAAVGIDQDAAAIDVATRQAFDRGLEAVFLAIDPLDATDDEFPAIGQPFDGVVDVNYFHTLSDEDRPRLLAALKQLLDTGGLYRFLCFSDTVPGTWGPRRISQAEIRETFRGPDWLVHEIVETALETHLAETPEVSAWLVAVERLA